MIRSPQQRRRARVWSRGCAGGNSSHGRACWVRVGVVGVDFQSAERLKKLLRGLGADSSRLVRNPHRALSER